MEDSVKHPAIAGRAIVTFARGFHSLAAIRSLGGRGIDVIAGDEYRMTPGAFSRYSSDSFTYPSPSSEPEAFLDKLDEVIDRHQPAAGVPYVLIPAHRESYLIAQHRARFEDRISLPMADSKMIENVRDKGWLVDRAVELGIPCPQTWQPRSADELRQVIEGIPLPAFVKVRRGAAGAGVHRVTSHEELLKAFDDLIEEYDLEPDGYPLVQEAAPGLEYCVSMLLDRGEPKAQLTYRNIIQYPAESGTGAVRETVAAEAAERWSAHLLSELNWHGIAQLDFRWDGVEGHEPQLIELNPRLFGGVPHALLAGVDYSWLLFQLGAGIPLDPVAAPEPGMRSDTPVTSLLAIAQEAAERSIDWPGLQQAWQEAVSGAEQADTPWTKMREFWRGLKDTVDSQDRSKEVERLLNENEDNLSFLLTSDDPMPLFGLLYPLAIFVKHGKVNTGLLVGADNQDPT